MAESSWLNLVHEIVVRMPERFTLNDLNIHFDTLRRAYPMNKNINAKVRQTLQRLRDQNVIAFLGPGTYRRLVSRPTPTLDIDFSAADVFKSSAQKARVALETWAKLNLWCRSCGGPTLLGLPPNSPVADLRCAACGIEYQVKSKNGRFEGRILGAAFEPIRMRAIEKTIPDYLLIEYDAKSCRVTSVNLVRGHEITDKDVLKRKPLRSNAKRAGWIGCEISTEGLTQIPIVAPAFLPRI